MSRLTGPWAINLTATPPPGRGGASGAPAPDWDALAAQPLPTTPASIATLGLGLAAPTGMAAAVLGLAAAQRADVRSLEAWAAVTVLTVLAVAAHGTVALALLASRRHGRLRRARLRQAGLVLSRWSSPAWFQRRLEGVAAGADRVSASGRGMAAAAMAAAVAAFTWGLVATGAVHPLAVAGTLPALGLAGIARHEAGEARRHAGARARVHLRASHVATHVLTHATAVLFAHTVAFMLLAASATGGARGLGW